jgi:alpha-tubulin suppressor-like RCC1 family protein
MVFPMKPPKLSIVALLLAALSGCRDDAPSLTEPESAPSTAAAVGGALSFVQVSAGTAHACGVATDGRAWCWGYAGNGQLGNGTTGVELCGLSSNILCSRRPVAVVGGLRFRQVTAGWDFTCGVATDDQAYCWGVNELGQLGAATPGRISTTPVRVAGTRRYRHVAAGGKSACGVTMGRVAICWGANNRGQLGNGTTVGSQEPVRVTAPDLLWRQVTVGYEHACGITTDDRARCWGVNEIGQLGDGTTTGRTGPGLVAGGVRFRQIEASGAHTCAVSTAAKGYCWGAGLMGDGSGDGVHPTPVALVGNRFYDNVSAGVGSCGVTLAGRGFCWGENGGRLGDGRTSDALGPRALAGDLEFVAISVGGGSRFSCGVTTDARAWCWGDNESGNLGDGTIVTRSVPTPMAGP